MLNSFGDPLPYDISQVKQLPPQGDTRNTENYNFRVLKAVYGQMNGGSGNDSVAIELESNVATLTAENLANHNIEISGVSTGYSYIEWESTVPGFYFATNETTGGGTLRFRRDNGGTVSFFDILGAQKQVPFRFDGATFGPLPTINLNHTIFGLWNFSQRPTYNNAALLSVNDPRIIPIKITVVPSDHNYLIPNGWVWVTNETLDYLNIMRPSGATTVLPSGKSCLYRPL